MTFTGKTAVINRAWLMCEVHSDSPQVILIMWKNPRCHFNVVCISFGLYFNVVLPKTEYFPVVVRN